MSSLSIYRRPEGKARLEDAYNRTLRQWPVVHECRYVDTRFGRTHIIAAGSPECPPMLLFHGFAFSSTMWIDSVQALSRNYRVYAVDFIGDINKSEQTEQVKNEEDCAAWFQDVMDGLGLRKAALTGLSYGGYLALLFAIRIPERVERIVSINPGAALLPQRKAFFLRSLMAGLFPSEARLRRFMKWMAADESRISDCIKDQFVVAMQNCLPRIRVFARCFRDEELRSIRVPVKIISSEREVQYNPYKALQRARALIPHVQTELLTEAGHAGSVECPDAANRSILSFA